MQPQTLSAEEAVRAALADAAVASVNPSAPAAPKPDLNGTFEAAQGSGALTCQIPDLVKTILSPFLLYHRTRSACNRVDLVRVTWGQALILNSHA